MPAQAEVDDALGEKLTDVIWGGPADQLTLTENAQPALMAVSLATMRVLGEEAGLDLARDAAFVAGHSLGEYSALAAAGALRVAADAPKGANILCMLPDTGERYLSTPLFADIPADMTEEEKAILHSTPAGMCRSNDASSV